MPFASIAGMEDAKLALRLLAIEPRLKGVLLGAGRGAGKSTLARAFGEAMGGLVEVPAGVTADRLLGGLDWAGALRSASPQIEPGLLARADGKVLCVDNAHLLEPWTAQQIADALTSGHVCLAREGFSSTMATRFVLVASFDPQDGDAPAVLRDALGLHVYEDADAPLEQRIAVMRGTRDRSGALSMRQAHAAMRPEDERRLIETAVALGITGYRADAFAVLAARASATLHGRKCVQEDDVRMAQRLVLYPRWRASPPRPEPAVRDIENNADPGAADGGEVTVAPLDARVPEEVVDTASIVSRERGRSVRAVSRGRRLALEPTIRAAAPFQRVRPPGPTAIRVTGDDLRYRELRERAATLIIFALDASGSMAASRMREAKGAAIHLLQTAYLRRAKVALVTFRGSAAQVLLEPTRSVTVARRIVDALPAGGGTPLAAGLEAAQQVAQSHRSSCCQTVLVLLTDGRANVARSGAVRSDLATVCRSIREQGVSSVVIDTADRFTAAGDAAEVAQMLGGRYYPLPRADARGIANTVSGSLRA